MVDRLGVPEADVPSLCQHFYTTYGTTLAGLVAASDLVEAPGPAFYDEWHAAVHHTLPYAALLGPPDPGLRALLASLPQKKYIFTNADAKHAEICLELLGLDGGLFDGVISFESVQAAAEARGLVRHGVPVVCKPADVAVALALDAAGVAASDAGGVVFFDDSARNVSMGAAAGVPHAGHRSTPTVDQHTCSRWSSSLSLATVARAPGSAVPPSPPPRSPSSREVSELQSELELTKQSHERPACIGIPQRLVGVRARPLEHETAAKLAHERAFAAAVACRCMLWNAVAAPLEGGMAAL
jgi:pyrimidine 5'-nucleotidase